MWTELFSLVIQLPPLAFGPVRPPAFAAPRALVCEVGELGRIQEPARTPVPAFLNTSLDPHTLRPTAERHLLNPAAEFLMIMGALASTRGGWDDRAWSTKRWDATGAVTPALIPPQAPPFMGVQRR